MAIKETEWMMKRKEIENAHLKAFTLLQNKELSIKNGMLLAVGISLLLIIVYSGCCVQINTEQQKNSGIAIKTKYCGDADAGIPIADEPAFYF